MAGGEQMLEVIAAVSIEIQNVQTLFTAKLAIYDIVEQVFRESVGRVVAWKQSIIFGPGIPAYRTQPMRYLVVEPLERNFRHNLARLKMADSGSKLTTSIENHTP